LNIRITHYLSSCPSGLGESFAAAAI
jgi:hypothetical protein